MASSSGGSYPLQNSGSDVDLQNVMDQRKKKRMVSNRESARRSRMRKEKHLNDLTTQLSQLRTEKNKIMADVSITMQHYMNVEAENLVLRAQVMELSHRLDSLNQIEALMSQPVDLIDELMMNSLSCVYASKPILASSDMIQY